VFLSISKVHLYEALNKYFYTLKTLKYKMKLTRTQRLMLYSLGHYYRRLNQELQEKPISLKTSKITFIELLLDSKIIAKQERAVYKNLEMLESKKLIEYENKMIKFTEKGLSILNKINKEIHKFIDVQLYFDTAKKPKRKLQTVIKAK
tara:strand:+ start:3606 stop:4049 length:444 start_codon:yes stop_codon:yes gene_type:complete